MENSAVQLAERCSSKTCTMPGRHTSMLGSSSNTLRFARAGPQRIARTAKADAVHRIATLDGWRGIAILMVLVDHYGGALTTGQRQPWWLWHRGMHGVCLFFVLSGFLITSRLLEEQRITGRINLRSFYMRRVFRLMPLAWLYLAVLLSLHRVWRIELAGCVLSFRNFLDLPPSRNLTTHFWSLSIEEQFYLFWPSILALGFIRARRVAIVLVVLVTAWRFWNWTAATNDLLGTAFQTQYWADALMIGCLTAIYMPQLRPYLRRWMLWPALGGLLFCTLHYAILSPLHESLCI